jgi:hypothetical protein
MDDVAIKNTIIENNVIISYRCYFACHGKGQKHTIESIGVGVPGRIKE